MVENQLCNFFATKAEIDEWRNTRFSNSRSQIETGQEDFKGGSEAQKPSRKAT